MGYKYSCGWVIKYHEPPSRVSASLVPECPQNLAGSGKDDAFFLREIPRGLGFGFRAQGSGTSTLSSRFLQPARIPCTVCTPIGMRCFQDLPQVIQRTARRICCWPRRRHFVSTFPFLPVLAVQKRSFPKLHTHECAANTSA